MRHMEAEPQTLGEDRAMKSVIFRGPVLTQSGYGQHSRMVAAWLLSRKDVNVKFQALPWGNTPWFLDANASDGLVGEIMKRTDVEPKQADVSFQLQLPNEWDPKIAKHNVGMSAVVETDRCHPSWITACNAMDQVIVPSQHAKLALTNSGTVTSPLHVVPESYAEAIEHINADDVAQQERFSTPFNFLIFGQITGNNPHNDRKNTFHAIKWLCETFKNDPDVGIVLKTNMGRNSKIDRNMVKNMLVALLNEVRKGPYPKLHLLHGEMSDKEVACLYRHPQIKALVSLTRGEGYGLPTLEATASGLPVVATGWSGHLDFLNLGKFVSVYYQLGDVHPSRIDDKIFVKGARWANASEDDFKKRIRKFKDSPAIPKEWAQELRTKILPKYSLKNICAMYDDLLGNIL